MERAVLSVVMEPQPDMEQPMAGGTVDGFHWHISETRQGSAVWGALASQGSALVVEAINCQLQFVLKASGPDLKTHGKNGWQLWPF
jgi:hypothetical protein